MELATDGGDVGTQTAQSVQTLPEGTRGPGIMPAPAPQEAPATWLHSHLLWDALRGETLQGESVKVAPTQKKITDGWCSIPHVGIFIFLSTNLERLFGVCLIYTSWLLLSRPIS